MTADLYAILGVRSEVGAAELRAAYRRLVREFHPDMAADKLAAHERLVQIVDAYKTLSEAEARAAYDRARRAHQPTTAPRYSWQDELRRQSHDALIVTAELFFIRGQSAEAIAQCRRLLHADPNNGTAYGVLGDFLRELGQRDEAMQCYTMAAQLVGDPRHRVLYQQKIDRLVKGEAEPETEVTPRPPLGALITRAGGLACVVSALGPISMLLTMSERASLWEGALPSGLLLGAAVVSAGLLSCGMTLLRWLGHADEEAFVSSFDTPGGGMTIGAWLLVSSFISFYLAVAAYVAIVVLEEQVSWSVVKVFVASAALIATFAVLMDEQAARVALWGGNVVFPSMMFGWMIGSIGRPRW